jgi:hypothetical protein
LLITYWRNKENVKRENEERSMSKQKNALKHETYTIDLTEIDGDGSVPCPKCSTIISPEDESEEVYKILDTKLDGNNELEGLLVECLTCGSIIKLTGFQQILNSMGDE